MPRGGRANGGGGAAAQRGGRRARGALPTAGRRQARAVVPAGLRAARGDRLQRGAVLPPAVLASQAQESRARAPDAAGAPLLTKHTLDVVCQRTCRVRVATSLIPHPRPPRHTKKNAGCWQAKLSHSGTREGSTGRGGGARGGAAARKGCGTVRMLTHAV